MVEFKDVVIDFGKFSLKDISFKIKKGTCHAILGPSGAGKSSLAKALLGLNRINAGAIVVEGMDITNLPVQKRGFAYVPQNLALFPHLSVEDNLLFNGKNRDELFFKLIKLANIEHLLNRYPKSLSGGERQRVALVRALLANSKLLILDEPFSALDISLKRELWKLIYDLKESLSVTILLITHDLNEAYFLSDEITILINGKIAQSDKKEIVFNKPKSLDVAKYLGYKNIFKLKRVGGEFLIDELNYRFKVDFELNSNIDYVVIKDDKIDFVNKKDSTTIKGEFRVLEFKDFNLIEFKSSKATLEIKVAKDIKPTNYIKLNSSSFIFVTSSNL